MSVTQVSAALSIINSIPPAISHETRLSRSTALFPTAHMTFHLVMAGSSAAETDIPNAHRAQMIAYAEALKVIFPGRAISAALLYSTGPKLIELMP